MGRRRINKHNKMVGEIMVPKIWQMNSNFDHVLIGRSICSKTKKIHEEERERERERESLEKK